MSKESDVEFERLFATSAGMPKDISYHWWQQALIWSRPLVAAAIAKAKKSRKQKSESGPYSDSFLEFWKSYPVGARGKAGKGSAFKVWKRLKVDNAAPIHGCSMLRMILKAVDRARTCEQWQKDGGQFIPNPATWLNRRGWEDELPGAVETQSEVRRAPVERSPEETEFYRRLKSANVTGNADGHFTDCP
jgi:hypothetical protein